MGERNVTSMGLISPKSLFCLFVIATTLFIVSWFSVLSSTGRPQFIDNSLLSHSGQSATLESENPESRSPSDHTVSFTSASPVHDREGAPQGNKALGFDSSNVLRVFMYDLAPEFHFELLGWKAEGKSVWPDLRTKVPDYPGGLNLQHSIEYWLTLDLLSSEFTADMSGRTAVRVHNSSEADVVFVPFFSSICYNRHSKAKPPEKKSRNKYLQEKLVETLTSREEWKRSGGRDHIVLAHHPNSLLDARTKLWPAMFILSDFGRYPPNVANVDKDVIAPYKHVVRNFFNDSSDFDRRPTLLYFQGAIYRKDGGFVRQELYYLLKNEKDVHFSFGSVQSDGISSATRGMHSSKFCLNIAGDTPSSNRLFDAIASHCVPVNISNEIELPYEDVLDYSEFCIFVRTSDALKKKYLLNLIRSIGREEWTRMWSRLKEIENFFEFRYPSKEGDAVQMIWQAVARKVPLIRLKLHRSRRYSRTPAVDDVQKSLPVPRYFG